MSCAPPQQLLMGHPTFQANLVGTRFGRYEVESRIASGGMAEVWQARLTGSAGFEKRVALKTLLPHLADNESIVQLFIQEAAMAAELSHPNVVQVYDFGCKEGRYFMAMEYVSGRTLRQVLQYCLRGGAGHLPMWALLEVALQACDAVGYIHAYHNSAGEPLGLVHRDVSPENLMVSYGGAVKLIDFGVAKVFEVAGRASSELAGKPRYMAPEQALGLDLDGRADLFSLGVVLYECATGRRPYTGKDAGEILEAVVKGRVRPALTRNPNLAPELVALIEKAMSTDRGARQHSAAELRNDLIRWGQSEGLSGLHHRLQPLMIALFADEPDLPAALRKQRALHDLPALFRDGDHLPPVTASQRHRVTAPQPAPVEIELAALESNVLVSRDGATMPDEAHPAIANGAPHAQPGPPAHKTSLAGPSTGPVPTSTRATATVPAVSPVGFGGFPSLGGWTAPSGSHPLAAPAAASPAIAGRTGASGAYAAVSGAYSAVSGAFPAVATGTPSDFEQLAKARQRERDIPEPSALPRRTDDEVPADAEALFEAGLLHYRRREWQRALQAWQRACEMVPDHKGWAFNLERVRQRIASEDAGKGE